MFGNEEIKLKKNKIVKYIMLHKNLVSEIFGKQEKSFPDQNLKNVSQLGNLEYVLLPVTFTQQVVHPTMKMQDPTNHQKPAYDPNVKYRPLPVQQPKVPEEPTYYQENMPALAPHNIHMPDLAANNIFISEPQGKYNQLKTNQKEEEPGIFEVSVFLQN